MASEPTISLIESPGEGFTFENYVGDVGTLVAHTGARPVLLGYSHAGFFTVHYALQNPDRLSAIILVEPALFNEREELLSRASKALEGDEAGCIRQMLDTVQPEVSTNSNLVDAITRFVSRSTSSSNSIGMELLARADHPVSPEMLASLKMPVLLIGGTRSHAAYTVHRAANALPFASTWWIEGATHLDIMSDQFADKLALAVNCFYASYGFDRPQQT